MRARPSGHVNSPTRDGAFSESVRDVVILIEIARLNPMVCEGLVREDSFGLRIQVTDARCVAAESE